MNAVSFVPVASPSNTPRASSRLLGCPWKRGRIKPLELRKQLLPVDPSHDVALRLAQLSLRWFPHADRREHRGERRARKGKSPSDSPERGISLADTAAHQGKPRVLLPRRSIFQAETCASVAERCIFLAEESIFQAETCACVAERCIFLAQRSVFRSRAIADVVAGSVSHPRAGSRR